MRILLAEDEDDLREALVNVLMERQQVIVIGVNSGDAAIDVLFADPHFDLIISDYQMPNGTGGDLLKFLGENSFSIPFVLCSSLEVSEIAESRLYPIVASVLKPDVLRPLVDVIERFRPMDEVIESKPRAQFFRVSLAVIMKISPLVCPLFIQLSEKKFVKIFNTGDVFGSEEEERFRVTKKLDSLYLRVDDCDVFVSALAKNTINIGEFIDKLNTPKAVQRLADLVDDTALKEDLSDIAMMLRVSDINPKEHKFSPESLEPVFAKAINHVKRLGFTPEVMALVSSNVNLALRVLSETKSLEELVNNLLANKGGYRNHSIYLAYIACSIGSIMSWKSDATRHKLALAALLHDIELMNEDGIGFESSTAFKTLSPREKRTLRDHPKKITDKLKEQNCNFAYNIEQILIQHHERPDGNGYPASLTATNIGPLASVFIVAHDLVDYLSDKEENNSADIKNFLKIKAEEYSQGHFQKISMAMQSLGN